MQTKKQARIRLRICRPREGDKKHAFTPSITSSPRSIERQERRSGTKQEASQEAKEIEHASFAFY